MDHDFQKYLGKVTEVREDAVHLLKMINETQQLTKSALVKSQKMSQEMAQRFPETQTNVFQIAHESRKRDGSQMSNGVPIKKFHWD